MTRIVDLLGGPEPTFSFEFFPPKTAEGEANFERALQELAPMAPSFVSVTYGAGGTTRDKTVETVRHIRDELGLEAMAHFTCVGATTDELRVTLEEIRAAGIENVLALRGDPPRGQEEWVASEGGLEFSHQLVGLLREDYDFSIAAACFPETHIHATSPEDDLRYLKEKGDAGVDYLITQLFFDNELYFDFVGRARAIGIDIPIIPGIMPITGYGQIAKITSLCGATMPEHVLAELDARQDDPQAVADFGVSYATMQCADLLAKGAPGIHFCTLNRSPATRAILSTLRLWRPWDAAQTGLGAPRKPPVVA
jgi:methylenetetrahydrofolate reductase (NADPH)